MHCGGQEIVVFDILKSSVCSSCEAELPGGSLFRMEKQTPVCLECADLDHLVFLPSGDAALKRRGRKHSTLRNLSSQSRYPQARDGVSVPVRRGRA